MTSVASAAIRPPASLHSATGSGRPYPPDIVATVRTLIVDSGLSYREAAARSGLREDTVGRWARRFGWGRAGVGVPPVRHDERSDAIQEPSALAGGPWVASSASPPRNDDRVLPSGDAAPAAPEPARRSRRPRSGPAVHEAARLSVEACGNVKRVARELGIGRATLYRWVKRFGWWPGPRTRRAPAIGGGKVGGSGPLYYRSRRFGRPYGGDAVGRVRDLVTGSDWSMRRIAATVGISYTTVRGWTTRRGWRRPSARRGSRRDAAERRAATIAAASDGTSRQAYPPAVGAAARELYCGTELPTRFVAARAGATRERVATWARTRGWTRPRDMPGPYDFDAEGRVRPLRRRRRRRGAAMRET